MPHGAAPAGSMKIFPFKKGGGAKRPGVVRSILPNLSRQHPEGFAFFPLLIIPVSFQGEMMILRELDSGPLDAALVRMWEASSGRRLCRSTATARRRAERASHVLDRSCE